MNKRIVRCLLVVIAILATVSCQTTRTAQQNAPQDEVIKKTVNQIWQQQATDWSNGDVEAYMSAYWQSEQLRFASGNSVTYGWQKTLDRYKKRYHNRDLMGELVFTPIDITVFSETDAMIFGRYHLDYKDAQGNAKSFEGLVTTNFRKMPDGQWKIIYDHTSD